MFGYVLVDKPEMKIKDYKEYNAHYCGLCRSLKKYYGVVGQMTLTYDLTFLSILLSALYEPEFRLCEKRCIAHPFRKHTEITDVYSEYSADMSILLTYYKCLDDWKDDKKLRKLLLAKLLSRKAKRLKKLYPEKIEFVKEKLNEISVCEEQNEMDIDKVSGLFGEIMAKLFVYKEDEWTNTLKTMGFFLGKFIYIIDAYEDYEEDIKSGSYNPLKGRCKDDNFDDMAEKLLTMMMAECARAFEFLPIVEKADILKNIIYSGVWTRFNEVKNKKVK